MHVKRDATDGGAPNPPVNRMAIALLSLTGFFVAAYLLAHNMGMAGPVRCGLGDCAAVQSSPYARIGPVPVAAIGVAGYAALFALALLGLRQGCRESRAIGGLLLGGSFAGMTYSAYLTYLEICGHSGVVPILLASAVIITLILLAAVPEALRARRSGP